MSRPSDAGTDLFAIVKNVGMPVDERLAAIRAALAAGADVGALDEYGCSVVYRALDRGQAHPEIIRALVAAGADVQRPTRSGKLPFDVCLSRRHDDPPETVRASIDAARVLFEAGARPGADAGLYDYRTASAEVVEFLLDVFPDVDATDAAGDTALHHFIRVERSLLVLLLLDRGARVDVVNHAGMTPLHVAYRALDARERPSTKESVAALEAAGAPRFVALDERPDLTPYDADAMMRAVEAAGALSDRVSHRLLDWPFVSFQELAGRMRKAVFEPEDTLAVVQLCRAALGAPRARLVDAASQLKGPFFHHGDLRVVGHLWPSDVFVVTGDLVVEGCVEDYAPSSFIVVGGDFDCHAINTESEVHVGGALRARDVVYGDYNDHRLIAETIRARLIIEHDHCIDGALDGPRFDTYSHDTRDASTAALQKLLVPEVFGVDEDEGDGELELNREALFERLRAGEPVFRDDA